MLTWFAFSLVWAYDASVAAGYLWYFAEVAIFLVIIATVPRDTDTVKLFVAMFVAGAVVSVAIGSVGLLRGTQPVEAEGRLSGAAGDPNYLAAALMPAVALTLGMASAAATRAGRYWSLAAVLPLVMGVAASQSRGGMVAAVVMAVVALVVFPRERWTILLCVCAVASVGATYFVANPAAWSASHMTSMGEADGTICGLLEVASRVTTRSSALDSTTSPLYRRHISRSPGDKHVRGILRGQELHNVYLGMVVEVGPLGLLLFLGVPLFCLRAAMAASRRYEAATMYGMSRLSRTALVALSGVLTTAVFLPNAADKRLWVLMALTVALSRVSRRVTGEPGNFAPAGVVGARPTSRLSRSPGRL